MRLAYRAQDFADLGEPGEMFGEINGDTDTWSTHATWRRSLAT